MKKCDLKKYIKIEVYGDVKNPIIRFYKKNIQSTTNAVFLFRKAQYYSSKESVYYKTLKYLCYEKLAKKYGIIVSGNPKIDIGLKFIHPTSIVIGANVVAGKDLHLYQNTTLGGAHIGDVNKKNHPILGNNVTVFANSLILGKLYIGNNVTVGANSLVLSSIPDNSISVGSPAKTINKGEKNKYV